MTTPSRDTTRNTKSQERPDDQWYKDAVIYQLHVRSFRDSDGDGIGDFVGLAQNWIICKISASRRYG
ncbi:MAG: hypothetical protein QM811_04080 [Pirellulales bacterium]